LLWRERKLDILHEIAEWVQADLDHNVRKKYLVETHYSMIHVRSFIGEGFVYGYDAIGSHERVKVVCTGSAQSQIQPVLDNQVEFKQQYGSQKRDLSLEETVDLVKDVFSSACERDIYTGDFLEIYKITKAGSEMERFELKLD